MKTDKTYVQQGDVILRRCGIKGIYKEEFDKIPKKAKPVAGSVLYYGDNNTHAFESGKFKILEHEKIRFVKVTKAAKLSHGEHGSHVIEPGEYFLYIVNEFDHPAEESRKVID